MRTRLENHQGPLCCYRLFVTLFCTLVIAFASNGAVRADDTRKKEDLAKERGHYLIYVHGRIIEDEGPNAVSERFGHYEFFKIKEKLQAAGHLVIADIRGPGGLDYVDTIVAKVSDLLSKDVSPDKITIVGFSKGGYMTLRAAAKLQNPDINYVILAGCIADVVSGEDLSADGAKGRFLSMVDASDDLGFPCQKFYNRNPQINDRADIIFETGEAHGLFYRANPVWIGPVLEWSSRN